jgi:LPS sulfotransferase NodH
VAPTRSYLVCATPRSGSTLVCQALRDTGVAGRPEEYFEALEHSGQPRRPEEYFDGVEDPSILNQLSRVGDTAQPRARSSVWDRTSYDRYLDWTFEQGTTPNGVFGAKLMWGYLGDFVSLVRSIPEYRDLPLAELLPAVFPDLTFVRVLRANKVRQAVSLWKAIQTATWRQQGHDDADPEQAPTLRFNYNAISHLLTQILRDEARWDAFFEHVRIKPVLVLYENFAADYETSTVNVLDRLGLALPDGFKVEPRMRSQSDGINDDWARRYSELRLGTEFDLVPAVPDPVPRPAG